MTLSSLIGPHHDLRVDRFQGVRSLGRVAYGTESGTATQDFQTVATVSLTVPQTGYVLVHGWVTSSNATGMWGVRVWDDLADTASRWNNYVVGTGDYSTSDNTAVYPVTAGLRAFSARVLLYTAGVGFTHYSTITAQFIPYNGTGSATLPPGSPPAEGPAEAGQQN